MAKVIDGAASALFTPLAFGGKLPIRALAKADVSEQMAAAVRHAGGQMRLVGNPV